MSPKEKAIRRLRDMQDSGEPVGPRELQELIRLVMAIAEAGKPSSK